MTLLPVGGAPAHIHASLVQVPPGLAIGDSTLLTAKGILVGVEQGAHLNAPRTRARQGLDGGPVSQIEHLHVDLVPSLAAVDQLQQRVAYLALGQYLHQRCLRIGYRRWWLRPVHRRRGTGKGHYRDFGGQQVERGRAAEHQGVVTVAAARVMGVGRGDQAGPVIGLIHHQGLAMVGAEIQHGQIAAQRHLTLADRIGQPASLRAVADMPAAQMPQPGPERV